MVYCETSTLTEAASRPILRQAPFPRWFEKTVSNVLSGRSRGEGGRGTLNNGDIAVIVDSSRAGNFRRLTNAFAGGVPVKAAEDADTTPSKRKPRGDEEAMEDDDVVAVSVADEVAVLNKIAHKKVIIMLDENSLLARREQNRLSFAAPQELLQGLGFEKRRSVIECVIPKDTRDRES